MAVSKPLHDNLIIFSCPICYETFKSPKILPCLHTFCEPCIHDFILSTGRKKDNKISQFACPICRTVVIPLNPDESTEKWSNTLQDNTTIATMIALSTVGKTQECHACKRSNEKSNAKFWCKICEEALCEKCNQMHSRMKLSYTHAVIKIEEYGQSTNGIDLDGISKQCHMHHSKERELFCFCHRETCCVLCLSTNHRRCTGLKSIEDVLSEDNIYEALPEILVKVKDTASKLLNEKEQHKKDFIANTETVEEKAAKFTEMIKCNTDNLFEIFKKQLHMFRDEQNTNLNIRLRLLEQFVKSLEHWISVTKIVKDEGSNVQLFVHIETMRSQIKASIIELNKTFKNDKLITLSLAKNEIIEQIQTAETLGTLEQTTKPLGQTVDLYKLYKQLGISPNYTFKELRVELLKTLHFKGSNMKCGISINDSCVIVGDGASVKKLYSLDKHTGAIIGSTVFSGDMKRLCYDFEFNQVFISCFGQELYCATLHGNEVKKPQKIIFDKEYVGALICYNQCIFLMVDDAIKSLSHRLIPATYVNLQHVFQH